jgi:AraC family transcriptional regulator of adaptative response / DNA-3-methyladenine glycosylase II
VLDTFRFSPSELRAKRRQRDRLVADGGLPLRVPYGDSFALRTMLRFFAQRALPGVETVDSTTYRRTITSCGHPGAIEVSDAEDGGDLLVLAHLPTFDSVIDDVARVRRLFGLDRPAAYRIASLRSDTLIGPIVKAHRGLRLAGAWDRFETAVRILISQRISVRAARTIIGRLAQTVGTAVPGLEELGLSHVFPSAERLAGASAAKLSALGIPASRAASIKALAEAYASEAISLEPAGSLGRLVDQLCAIPGIGPWSANCIALRATGHLDAFPAEDLGLRRVAGRLAGGGLMSREELLARAEAWRPFRGLAAMHLWAAPN